LKPEQLLLRRTCNHLKFEHSDIPFRVDIGADVPLPIHLAKINKELHGKFSKGYPDVLVCHLAKIKGRYYGGLYLELKATDKVVNSAHTRTQATFHEILRRCGFKVSFCCGFEDCKEKIDKYLKKIKKYTT